MIAAAYVMGLDYGTDSVRCILVDANNGVEMAAAVYYYPRWKEGLFCNPSKQVFRQHPLDYIEGLEATIKDCLKRLRSFSDMRLIFLWARKCYLKAMIFQA